MGWRLFLLYDTHYVVEGNQAPLAVALGYLWGDSDNSRLVGVGIEFGLGLVLLNLTDSGQIPPNGPGIHAQKRRHNRRIKPEMTVQDNLGLALGYLGFFVHVRTLFSL